MTIYMSLLVVIFLSNVCRQVASNCEEKIAETYLEEAVHMIKKASHHLPACASCANHTTQRALDCSDLLQMGYKRSGVYTIWPTSRITEEKSLEVYCDMETDGGGWTLIQRRGNFQRPNDYFFKDWQSYKEGFGVNGEDFWLGNDYIFALSNQRAYSLRFDLKDVENSTRFAEYNSFWIDDENHKYMLHIADYSGDAGDSMISHHNNKKFSTNDQDNDSSKDENCAQLYKGGWWYGSCHYSNLNGLYLRGKHETSSVGVNWLTWKGYTESLEATEMKIRPKNFKLSLVPANNPM